MGLRWPDETRLGARESWARGGQMKLGLGPDKAGLEVAR